MIHIRVKIVSFAVQIDRNGSYEILKKFLKVPSNIKSGTLNSLNKAIGAQMIDSTG